MNIRQELLNLYRYGKTSKGFSEAYPLLLILLATVVTSVVPTAIYQNYLCYEVGDYAIDLSLLTVSILFVPIITKTKKNPAMIGFCVFFLIFGLISIPLAKASEASAILTGIYTALPFLLVSCIRFTPFQGVLLRWIILIPFFAIVLQVLLYGLGFLTYVSESTGNEVGRIGEASRIGSTVGKATGTSVFIFLCALLSALLFIKRPFFFWGILAISFIATVITQSRGTTLMMACYLLALSTPFLKEANSKGGGFYVRILMLGGVLFGGAGFLYLKPDVVEQWRKRVDYFKGDAFDLAGRDVRGAQAIAIAKKSHYLGVGLGNYSPRKKLMLGSAKRAGIGSPHNVYLLLLGEIGIVGALGYIALQIRVLYRGYKYNRWMATIGLFILLGAGHNTEYVYLHMPFIWVFALLLAYVSHEPYQAMKTRKGAA
ncbi:O-antigen ligase family protein [Rubritalea profundi]|uniref:O-antigen ligase-related domain-containing protein n=1 Tax=Rubritalea profundi TaxID=1658618 RepID=A0A2S7U0F5_9BACT|nr:O-antigen ligase family protein [Rubritalea profundi]PQJ28060.1 hypothetical protein BSZ32_05790 [Rubritalea profundi]